MKIREKIKKVSVLCLVFLLSINSFAAIVSDNDGSAFVTKAEFDALKTTFNKQIDDYNSSIDGKIDGAIASYLAGLRLETAETGKNFIYTIQSNTINKFASCFVDKSSMADQESDNNVMYRTALWLFYVWGWNIAASNYLSIVNLKTHNKGTHARDYVRTVDNNKYYLKKYVKNTNTYYGPYNDILTKPTESVISEKVATWWECTTVPVNVNINTCSARTWDLSPLGTPGTITLADYTFQHATWSPDGTIMLAYDDSHDKKYKWACLASQGAIDSTATYIYGIDYDDRMKLKTLIGPIYDDGSYCGGQYQIFSYLSDPGYTGNDAEFGNRFQWKFKTPEVIKEYSKNMVNWVASETIGEPVYMYQGIPFTSASGDGKIKARVKISTYNMDMTSKTGVKSSVKIKSAPFNNTAISSETTDIVFEKDNLDAGWVDIEFPFNTRSGSTEKIFYIKVNTTAADTIIKLETDAGDPPIIIKVG